MSLRTYDTQGRVMLDSNQAVFGFVKSGKLTRLLNTPPSQNKREVWYRAKRLGINSKMRNRMADIHTPEYCMYYIDVPNAISPLAAVYYNGLAKDCNPVIYLNTGFFNGKARLMFYSDGRLSDSELNKYQIYIFDARTVRETVVGINTYDRQGNVTFSNRVLPMQIVESISFGNAQAQNLKNGQVYHRASRQKIAVVNLMYYNVVLVYQDPANQYIKEDSYQARLSNIMAMAVQDGYILCTAINASDINTMGNRINNDPIYNVIDDGVEMETWTEYEYGSYAFGSGERIKNTAPYQGNALAVNVSQLPFPYN